VKSPPDGYTLVMVALSSAVNATLYDKLPFNFLRDIDRSEPSAAATSSCWRIHPSRPRPGAS
jgi:hypothetical protein